MTVVSDACRKDTKKLTVIPISYVGTANPPSTILSPALNTTSPTILITTITTTLSTINITLMGQPLEKWMYLTNHIPLQCKRIGSTNRMERKRIPR